MSGMMMKHSERYKDDDLLSASQVAEIVYENSGSPILPGAVATLCKRWGIELPKIGHVYAYPYGLVKDLSPSRHNAGRPRQSNPSPNALRQRKFKEKRRQEQRQACGTIEVLRDGQQWRQGRGKQQGDDHGRSGVDLRPDLRLNTGEDATIKHSERYHDDDQLVASQVAEIISENSGLPFDKSNVSAFCRRHGVPSEKLSSRIAIYRYVHVKDLVSSRKNAGRPLSANPSPAALYQRKFKELRREGVHKPHPG